MDLNPLKSRDNDSSLNNSEAKNAWISNFRPSASHRGVIRSHIDNFIFSTITIFAIAKVISHLLLKAESVVHSRSSLCGSLLTNHFGFLLSLPVHQCSISIRQQQTV